MISCKELTPYEVSDAWVKCLPWLKKAHLPGYASLSVIYNNCKTGRLRMACFYLNGKLVGTVVVEFIFFPDHSVLNVVLMGGKKLSKWQDSLHRYLQRVKRLGGASFICFNTVRRAERVLARYGYYLSYYGYRSEK